MKKQTKEQRKEKVMKEYGKVVKPALKELKKIQELAWKEYEKTRESAFEEYKKIQEPAWKECEKKWDEIENEATKEIIDYYYNPDVECTCKTIFDDTHKSYCKRRKKPNK